MKPGQTFHLFITLVVFSSAVFAAPIYKWQDEDGRTWFSDQPVEDSPAGNIRVEQINLQTHFSEEQRTVVDHPYSILNQVEYFQTQQERQQKLILEKKLVDQAMKAAEKQQSQIVMPPLDTGVPAIVSVPQYRPQFYPQFRTGNQHHRHQPHHAYRGSSLSYIHQGNHHRFSFNLGGLNHLSYRNF